MLRLHYSKNSNPLLQFFSKKQNNKRNKVMKLKKHYKLTIDFTTDDKDWCGLWGAAYLIEDLTQLLGCSDENIDIETEEIIEEKDIEL